MFNAFRKSSADLYVIAGLGNLGDKYEHTRHNIGFDTIDALSEKYRIPLKQNKFKGLYGKGKIEGKDVILVKPQTFMNASGDCIAPLLHFYKVDPNSHFFVIFDDISLEPGNIRVKAKGSAGGHNGIKSLIAKLGTEGFARIKIGVGEKPQGWDLADHVLGRFSKEDRIKVEEAIEKAETAAELILDGQIAEAMNRFNRKEKAQG
jgi:peptidyl-tRNA hydrolase, PTH1 family